MTDLFSDAGLQALDKFSVVPLICLFDFDGTLAPIEKDPMQVFLPPLVQQKLQALQHFVRVGIVTGRALKDLRSRLEFVPDYLIGNHGIEGIMDWESRSANFPSQCALWLEQLGAGIAAIDPAIWIEDKHYSLSVHFLEARDVQYAMQELALLITQLHPAPRVIAGKNVFNLLPAAALDKGQAVLQLLAQAKVLQAIYVGDDVTDEDVFKLRHPEIFTVRVGGDEQSAAAYCIPDYQSIGALLDLLLACLARHAILTSEIRHSP